MGIKTILASRKNPFKIKKSTPNMTSSSVNGYTIVEGFSGIFNYGVGYATGSVNYNNWHTYGIIQLAQPTFITDFDEGNTQGYNYVGTTSSIVFYLNGVAVYTYNYNPRDRMGLNTVLPTVPFADKIAVNSCYGSIWDGGSAQETYRFNGYILR